MTILEFILSIRMMIPYSATPMSSYNHMNLLGRGKIEKLETLQITVQV